MFKINKKSKISQARVGVLKTRHGEIKTPFFMPVATQGAVKHVSPTEMERLGASVLLANTYHLMLRPGEKLVKKAGGLHAYMGWGKPILTDSGGFQVFSLSGAKNKAGRSLVKINERGARFRSYIDGQEYNLTPEKSLQIQLDLGVDIAVCLDECVALPAKRAEMEKAVDLTSRWAMRTKAYLNKKNKRNKIQLFAVVQGGLDKDLRLKSLRELAALGFDGYNIGGLSVGESAREMYQVLDYLVPAMPEDKPRYLMGVGYPENIVRAVQRGVDMFDCVIPTREGRHGRLFLFCHSEGAKRPKNPAPSINREILRPAACGAQNDRSFYSTINITNSKYAKDFKAINPESKLPELRRLSKAYLHYLFKINEPLGQRLASLNNLEFYLDLMAKLRYGIKSGKL